jgi:hypothetical protein
MVSAALRPSARTARVLAVRVPLGLLELTAAFRPRGAVGRCQGVRRRRVSRFANRSSSACSVQPVLRCLEARFLAECRTGVASRDISPFGPTRKALHVLVPLQGFASRNVSVVTSALGHRRRVPHSHPASSEQLGWLSSGTLPPVAARRLQTHTSFVIPEGAGRPSPSIRGPIHLPLDGPRGPPRGRGREAPSPRRPGRPPAGTTRGGCRRSRGSPSR